MRCPLGQWTSSLKPLVGLPAAKTSKASSAERYLPPQVMDWLWETGPLRQKTFAPIPWLLPLCPLSCTARRVAGESLRNKTAGPSSWLSTTSRSPSPSRSATAIPGQIPATSNPQARPTSSNPNRPVFRNAQFGVSNRGNRALSWSLSRRERRRSLLRFSTSRTKSTFWASRKLPLETSRSS